MAPVQFLGSNEIDEVKMNTLTLFGFVLWLLVVFQDGCVGKSTKDVADLRNHPPSDVQTYSAEYVKWIPGSFLGIGIGTST